MMAAAPDLAGTVSGQSGFIGTLVGAAAAQAAGLLDAGTPTHIMCGMAAPAGRSLGAAAVAFRQRPR